MRLPSYRFSHIAAAGVGRAALGQAGSVCRVKPPTVGWALGVLAVAGALGASGTELLGGAGGEFLVLNVCLWKMISGDRFHRSSPLCSWRQH